nr:unnamed protein product [Spirometra erinaceieuropaei]
MSYFRLSSHNRVSSGGTSPAGLALSASPDLTDKDINAEISVDDATVIHSYSTLNEEGLIPRQLTATAMNSHSIIVSWEAPRRSNELNGLYELMVYNGTHEENSHLWTTEDTITDLEPSTTYNFTVQAFWKNDTPVGVVAVTSARTNPKEDLIPRDFTATAVNSHSIIVSWEAPRRSNDLNELYELTVSNGTHEENSYLWATEDTITDLQPSTSYNFTVQAFWKNDTPVGVVAVTSARTMPRGDLSEEMTVYFCEEHIEPCKPYKVYGRSGYAENFERHAMCVSLCQFVAKVEHSSENYFEMCPDSMDPCLEIKRNNGTFDAFNKCAFKCDGWPKLENSLEDTAFFCPHEGICEEVKFFSNPNAGNAFAGLKTCFTNCMSE